MKKNCVRTPACLPLMQTLLPIVGAGFGLFLARFFFVVGLAFAELGFISSSGWAAFFFFFGFLSSLGLRTPKPIPERPKKASNSSSDLQQRRTALSPNKQPKERNSKPSSPYRSSSNIMPRANMSMSSCSM